jgi:formyl-CoA transferase
VPYQAFDAADAPMLVCCGNDRLFAKFAAVVGRPDWPQDERFATNRKRLANKAVLLPEIATVMRARPRAEWLDRLIDAGVPCAPINTVPEVLEEPQAKAMEMLQPVPGEDFSLVALPISFDGERPRIRRVAPRLGEHTDEMLDSAARLRKPAAVAE